MKKVQLALATAMLLSVLAKPVFAAEIVLSIGTPPPAPIVEAVPPAPGPDSDYAWRAGYWRWVDERHVWIPGHWAKRPRPAAVWIAPAWEHGPDGYRFHEGHWDDAHPDDHHDDHHEDHR